MGKIKERFLQCKKNQGGFTLVEMIVVLVIIAILASLMLGALNGYIDKAKEKEVLADCRSVVLAANTVGSEVYSGKTALSSAYTGAGAFRRKAKSRCWF